MPVDLSKKQKSSNMRKKGSIFYINYNKRKVKKKGMHL